LSEWDTELQLDTNSWLRTRLQDGGLFEICIEWDEDGERKAKSALLNRSQLALLSSSMGQAAGMMM
jgi:hypothetical protein